jgi:hypothetical protein
MTELQEQYTEYEQRLQFEADTPILGMLAWYSVPESVEVKHSEFVGLVELNDAPLDTPNVPKPANVFRRACNKAKIMKVPTPNPDVFVNYTMRDASYDENFVFRRMIAEQVDAENHELGYRDIGLAIFSKDDFTTFYISDVEDDDPAKPYWDSLTQQIDDYLKDNKVTLPAIAIREAARRGLTQHLSGTAVRESGGVYFVASTRRDKLEALDRTINGVKGATFHTLPLVDDLRQRDMLKNAFEDETVAKSVALVAKITELLGQGTPIPAKTFLGIRKEYSDLKTRLNEYQDLLNDSLNKTETALEVANRQVLALLEAT